jgi:hypothetical protein
MKAYANGKVEKCQPLLLVHRFGTNGAPIEPEFGAIILWVERDFIGKEHSFNLRADVLERDYPLLMGSPILMAMKAALYFGDLKLSAVINARQCDLPLRQNGNHVFMDHAASGTAKAANHTLTHLTSVIDLYKPSAKVAVQFFLRPDHC